jgi:hypothetical protein
MVKGSPENKYCNDESNSREAKEQLFLYGWIYGRASSAFFLEMNEKVRWVLFDVMLNVNGITK